MMRFSRAITRPALAKNAVKSQARGLVVASQTARAKEAPVSISSHISHSIREKLERGSEARSTGLG